MTNKYLLSMATYQILSLKVKTKKRNNLFIQIGRYLMDES